MESLACLIMLSILIHGQGCPKWVDSQPLALFIELVEWEESWSLESCLNCVCGAENQYMRVWHAATVSCPYCL